jgi:hypothetical protein
MQAKGFLLKKTLCRREKKERARKLFILSRNQLKILQWLQTGHCHLK